jgi:hypothetical protein
MRQESSTTKFAIHGKGQVLRTGIDKEKDINRKAPARYKLGLIRREIPDVEGTRAVKDFKLSK